MKTAVSYCLLIVVCLCAFQPVSAQMIAGNIFLQGNHIEAGVASNGALGSGQIAPPSYHSLFMGRTPAKLGIVADPDRDGWVTGTPPFIGDYFLAGTPLEEWDIQINGFNARASRGEGDSSFTFGLAGANTAYHSSGNERVAEWNGKMGDLMISQTITMDVTKMYLLFRVKLKNAGAVKLNKVFYNRSIDPDNEVEQSARGYPTHMKIKNQIPDPKQKVLVTAVGDEFGSYLGMCTKDCRARAYFLNSGLIVTSAIDSLFYGIGPASSYYYSKTDSVYSDVGMGLIFNIGTLNPGDSTYLSYGYLLSVKDLDALMDAFTATWTYNGVTYHNNDTIVACEGESIKLGIVANGHPDWRWDHSPLLSDTIGISNTVTVKGIQTYTVARYYAASCGGGYDTIRITIKGSVPIKPVIMRSGLTLSVMSDYASYTWYKDGVATTGTAFEYTVSANGHYYVRVVDKYGCVTFSDTVVVDDLSLSSATIGTAARIYPNPVKDKVYVDAKEPVEMILSDLAGRVLLRESASLELNVSQLADGFYLLRIYDHSGRQLGIQKIEKRR